MPLQNTFELDVDFKHKSIINEPTVTQNDEVTFILNIYDDGMESDLSEVSTSTLVSERPDKQSIMTLGEITGTNQITFPLGSTEISKVGKVDATIQLYGVDGRVSTMSFTYKVLKDPGAGYIPSTDEQTLIELVLGEGPAILNATKQATLDAQTFIADYGRREEYDNASLYKKGNEVGYNGSSYVALQDTQGNLPTNFNYWALRARKGLGDVNSVNGIEPDLNGNVTLPPYVDEIDFKKHDADETEKKHIMISDIQPQSQGVGGIWFETGLGESEDPGGGEGSLVLQNAIVADDPPGDTTKIWLDI